MRPYSVIHKMQFERNLRVICDHDVTICGLIAIQDFKPHLKFERIASASSIFGCAWRIFLVFVIVKPPCRLVLCEWTSDYGRRFVTVTARQLQLQPLWNCCVNDAYVKSTITINSQQSSFSWAFSRPCMIIVPFQSKLVMLNRYVDPDFVQIF